MKKYLVSFRRCEKLESYTENGKNYVGPVFREHLLKEVKLEDIEDKVDVISEIEGQTDEMVFGTLRIFDPNTRICVKNWRF